VQILPLVLVIEKCAKKSSGFGIRVTGCISCQCLLSPELFLERLEQFVAVGNAAGVPVSFPTDYSVQSRPARIDACIDTLQSFDDVLGEGCPIAAAPYFSALQAIPFAAVVVIRERRGLIPSNIHCDVQGLSERASF
jgi:hypothetical protein